ncbi:MAG: DoxX family protein, partial [Gammaproteobacteria bacterium]|nr:DoxX family protein [Gammaproteobacteria bacterium]
MNTVLWIFQGILTFMFLMVGTMKLMQPKEKMADKMGWVEDFSQGQIRVIGILEVLGALGLVLPMLTGILPILTPLAALGLVFIMLGAFST